MTIALSKWCIEILPPSAKRNMWFHADGIEVAMPPAWEITPGQPR